jgi:hypothetical protein
VGRTIIIGDVHGCSAELSLLIEKLGVEKNDHVYFVGDLVARGPDTRGVLRIVRELGARAVLGNHERRLLEVRHARAHGETRPRLGPSHAKLLEELADEDWTQIERMPLYVDVPAHELRVVHAGLVPGVPMEQQDPWLLTHLRSIDKTGKATDKSGPVLWGSRYVGPPHVVFGHNAIARVQLHAWATGIDSGCVYGGELTALVLGDGETVPPISDRNQALVTVQAKRRYYDG